jgi:PEP-CTERM/exosortase A-associated glycosyltransferase
MRILHVLDHSIPLHSGYTFRTRAILEQQRAFGWETGQMTSAKHTVASGLTEEVDGLLFFRTIRGHGWLSRLPLLKQISTVSTLARRLAEVVDEVRPDILHAHSPALNGLAALRVAKSRGLPLVYECRAFWEDAAVDHGTCREGDLRYWAIHRLESYVFRRAQAITTICEGLRTDIVGRGIPAEKVTVIPNGVDLKQFQPGGRADPSLADSVGVAGKTVLGFIGSFYAYEGLSLMLEALPLIVEHQPEIRLLLVGGGPQEEALKGLVRRLGVENRVIFTGRIPHQKVQDYYNLVDILVYPRYSMRLTELVTPLKPLEAMAQGRLVVASDVGGQREMIEHGKTGLLFKAGDRADLAKQIVDLLDNEELRATLKACGRHYAETERTWAASVARYRPVYERLMAAGRS